MLGCLLGEFIGGNRGGRLILRMSVPEPEAYPPQAMLQKGLFAATCLGILAGCAGPSLASKPGAYSVSQEPIKTAGREIHLTYVRPVQPRHPGYLVVFATGDAGWCGEAEIVLRLCICRGQPLSG